MIIRRAIPAELPAVVALVNAAYRGEAARAGWASEAGLIEGPRTSLALLTADLAAPGERRIVTLRAERGGPLLGCMMLERIDIDTLGLGLLSVAPEGQNQGIGRRLIGAAEAFGRETGASRLHITVIQHRQALVAWYERHGFVRTGATAPFPYGDDRFGTPLRDDLHFVVLEKALA